MSRPVASVIPLTVKVRLNDVGKHRLFGNTPDLIEIAQRPDLAACVPAQAAGLFQAATNEELISQLAKLLAELEFDTFIVGVSFKQADPDGIPSAAVMVSVVT